MATTILFLSQGRASEAAAMGHVRVRHALNAGMPGVSEPVEVVHDAVPPWSWFQQHRLLRWVEPLKMWNFLALRWHLLRGLLARRLVEQHLGGPDPPAVIHVTTSCISFLLPKLQPRVPCVLSLDTPTIDWAHMVNGLRPGRPGPIPLRVLKPLERRALTAAPLSIAWTDTVAKRVREIAPTARVATLHPGLDLEQFQPRRGPRRDGPVRVLFVGARWRDKGGPDLLEALNDRLRTDVHLDVVTGEALESRAGLAIHEATPGSSVTAQLFARADVFCLPTTVDACPWVVVEALASGLPIVASDTSSIRELVGDGGIVVPQRDPARLREALEQLIDQPELRERMGAAGRRRAEERYDARVNTPKLIRLLTQVAAEHTPGWPVTPAGRPRPGRRPVRRLSRARARRTGLGRPCAAPQMQR